MWCRRFAATRMRNAAALRSRSAAASRRQWRSGSAPALKTSGSSSSAQLSGFRSVQAAASRHFSARSSRSIFASGRRHSYYEAPLRYKQSPICAAHRMSPRRSAVPIMDLDEDFRNQMRLAVWENCRLHEAAQGSTDLLGSGPVTHGPWPAERVAAVLRTWLLAGLIGLYFDDPPPTWTSYRRRGSDGCSRTGHCAPGCDGLARPHRTLDPRERRRSREPVRDRLRPRHRQSAMVRPDPLDLTCRQFRPDAIQAELRYAFGRGSGLGSMAPPSGRAIAHHAAAVAMCVFRPSSGPGP
jgi:hypothetical protein